MNCARRSSYGSQAQVSGAPSIKGDGVVAGIRCGRAVTDDEFDYLFQPSVRERSDMHWTPVAAALRAAQWLAPSPHARVLDVGSGCGKFCLVGALSSPATFVGVERRLTLVRAAESVASKFAITRAQFIHADFPSVPWDGFDAFYFYNPFAEYLYGAGVPYVIDDSAPGQPWRYDRAIQIVESRLKALPLGTRIVCFNGYGGEMPRNFHIKEWARINDCCLRLWVKEGSARL